MTDKTSLLYLANLRMPTEKAYGIQIVKMCEAFALSGLEVCLIAPHRISKVKDDLFNYYSVRKNFKFKKLFSLDLYLPGRLNIIALGIKNLISAIILVLYALNKRPDIIYSRDELPLFILSFLRGDLVYEAHRFSGRRVFFYKRFRKKNLKVVVITARLKEDFYGFGFNNENLMLAPDGVDPDEFDISMSKEEARNKIGLPLDAKIVVYAGHSFKWKGADTLLQAATLASEALFVLVGGMPADIRKITDGAATVDNILIMGHRPRKDIPVFLKAADILVLPNSAKEEISRLYTSPLKLFEYMASKRPIIASDLPSIREILNDGNAVLVSPDDSYLLSEKIKMLLEDRNLGNNISEQAFRDVARYTWGSRALRIADFFKSKSIKS